MATIITRPYTGKSERQALFDLLLASRADEHVDPWPPLRNLRLHWHDESPAALARSRVWQDRASNCLPSPRSGMAQCSSTHSDLTPRLRKSELHDAGAEVALAGVNSWNDAAHDLLASVGFQLRYRVRWYIWEATRATQEPR